MRRDASFTSGGQRCAAWLYLPDGLSEGQTVAGVVLANGISMVKEMYVWEYAERFAAAGLAALVFDHRHLGESEGEPRQQIFPEEQQDDIRNAISFLADQPEADGGRIGVWGVSYGAAHVLPVAAYDRRVRAVVSVAPVLSTYNTILRFAGTDGLQGFLAFLDQDQVERYHSGTVNYMPLVSNDGSPAMNQNPKAYAFYAEGATPNWRNQLTVESLQKSVEYRPAAHVALVAPTPLLMVMTEQDTFAPTDFAEAAFSEAGEPKRRVGLACDHPDVFFEPWLSQSADAAVDWYRQHLG
jgi:uncharacterized protein